MIGRLGVVVLPKAERK